MNPIQHAIINAPASTGSLATALALHAMESTPTALADPPSALATALAQHAREPIQESAADIEWIADFAQTVLPEVEPAVPENFAEFHGILAGFMTDGTADASIPIDE